MKTFQVARRLAPSTEHRTEGRVWRISSIIVSASTRAICPRVAVMGTAAKRREKRKAAKASAAVRPLPPSRSPAPRDRARALKP
eukprot:31117-Pelagococcus_subviridis.AAC.5